MTTAEPGTSPEASPSPDDLGLDGSGSNGRKRTAPASQEEEAEKLAARREANRIHAFKSRQRSKALLQELQRTVELLSGEKSELERENAVLRAQVDVLQQQNLALTQSQRMLLIRAGQPAAFGATPTPGAPTGAATPNPAATNPAAALGLMSPTAFAPGGAPSDQPPQPAPAPVDPQHQQQQQQLPGQQIPQAAGAPTPDQQQQAPDQQQLVDAPGVDPLMAAGMAAAAATPAAMQQQLAFLQQQQQQLHQQQFQQLHQHLQKTPDHVAQQQHLTDAALAAAGLEASPLAVGDKTD